MDGSFERRLEDHRLLTGVGNFQDDEWAAGAVWGVFVRSPHAFADIRGIDTAAAKAAPGVLAVLTAADLDAAGIGTVSIPVPVPGAPGMVVPHRPSLAGDCARHVGDTVALVVAETEAQARDAAELVEVDYASRDAVADIARAAEPGAPQIWPEAPGNLAVDWHPHGAKPEERAELDAIFAGAAHVARVRLVNQRIAMAPMEPRGALVSYDPQVDRYVLHCASQSAFVMRQHVARTMGVDIDRLRVVSGDVGGAFGMRTSGYPEYPALLLAAKQLGRPVRWRSTRQEGFLSDNQARDTIINAKLALDADGKFLALDVDSIAALGAYHTSHGAFIATVNFARCLPLMYDIAKVGLRIRCLFTNTVPTGPYRGAGRPEANYAVERLVEEAARVTGIDRIDLRRRNLIPANRVPYKTAVGTTYDSGDFPSVFDEALARADIAGFAARKVAS
ncbi:MAG TPA: molybdopterin cofactor-binding domain-containing protein, partial [Stellaceae bacterium]|nr:molybdopterin cofactor-binding domain-containing protein [Stellaceae bacterium]